MRVHAIIIALNEADFIQETIKPLYEHCSGISVITQYDRDYRGRQVEPDDTVQKVLSFPDPSGKIHLVVRRYNDETSSRNHEMLSLLTRPHKHVEPHAWSFEKLNDFHRPPDYFLIVDADEIYDIESFPRILQLLRKKRPTAMYMCAHSYVYSWRFRVCMKRYTFRALGFVRAGVLFKSRRVVSWMESRLNKLGLRLKLSKRLGSRLLGFTECPIETGVFHHGVYVRRDFTGLQAKLLQHSEGGLYFDRSLSGINSQIRDVLTQQLEKVDLTDLPMNIRQGNWPKTFFDDTLPTHFS